MAAVWAVTLAGYVFVVVEGDCEVVDILFR